MNREKKKLYRRDNKTARGYFGDKGGDYCHSRNTKAMTEFEGQRKGMGGKVERGVDYTPLYKFLLSKVGKVWGDVYAEAVSRLDKKDPIFDMVVLVPEADNGQPDYGVVRVGNNSYYSMLTVDEQGVLVKVNPNVVIDDLEPSCPCCTHTFNGEVFTQKHPLQIGK